MGFGLLFFGYFFMFSMPFAGVDVLPDLAGCILMGIALKKIGGYCPDNRGFRAARRVLIPFSVLAGGMLLWQIVGIFTDYADWLLRYVYTPATALYSLVIGAFHLFLLLGIYTLATEVELSKLAARARRLITLTVIYYLLQLLSGTGVLKRIANLAENPTIVSNYLNMGMYVIGLLWFVLTWLLIFSCYMRICLEGDEEMPYHEDFTDRIRNRIKKKVDELNTEPEPVKPPKNSKKK